MWYRLGLYSTVPWRTVVQEYRTGEWDLASLCVVHIGIVLYSPTGNLKCNNYRDCIKMNRDKIETQTCYVHQHTL